MPSRQPPRSDLLEAVEAELTQLRARNLALETQLAARTSELDAATRAAVLVRQLLADATGRVPSPPTPARGQEAVPDSRRCVLIVDDEQLVRDVGARLLEAVGFDVMLATGGHDALDVFRREHVRIDVVLLDLSMPDLTGREVLRRLLAFDPAVKVVLWSGYSDGQDFESAESLGAKGFLAKPFSVGELTDVLRRVLAMP